MIRATSADRFMVRGLYPLAERPTDGLAPAAVPVYQGDGGIVRVSHPLQAILQDVRFSARLLVKDRAFTAVAVLALALGVGANNTLFTVVNAICIRGLPIDGADRVIDVSNRDGSGRPSPLSPRQFEDLGAARLASVHAFAAYVTRPATLRDDQSAAERMTVAYISTNAFTEIGARPILGRDFRDEDARAGAEPVAILGADLWQSRYSADRGAIGRVVKIDGVAVSIVGVMPDRFRFPDNADAWRPLAAFHSAAEARVLTVYGRLAPGATLARARDGVAAALAYSPATTDSGAPLHALAVPIHERYRGDITNPAWIVFITVGLLLVVIACSNVANLLLARGARRGREMAIRRSLGASRFRIVRQLLIESAMLAALGGAGAVAVSMLGNRLLSAAIPPGALPYFVTLTIDARVAAVLTMVCGGAVLLFGLAPALHLARTSASSLMKETGSGTSHDRGAARWTWLFLTCQLALTVMLLSKLDFTVRTFFAQASPDPVVDARSLLTFGVTLPADVYPSADRRLAFYRTLADRLGAGGRTTVLSLATAVPFSGAPRRFAAEDQQVLDTSPRVSTASVDRAYFQALGIDVVEGHGFGDIGSDADREAIVVNRRFAELLFGDKPAIGRRVRIGAASGPGSELRTVIGVVPSVRQDDTLQPEPAAYLPIGPEATANVVMLARTTGDASQLAPVVRDEMRRLDAGVPLTRVMTLAAVNWNARWNPRVASEIVIAIAIIALALATVGLAALTAYAVAARRRELGIRLALGATSAGVTGLVLRRVAAQAAAGVMLGALGAKLWDPGIAAIAILAASLVVAAIVLGVSAWPAARAARIDPLATLRES
jgi:predicted permease